MCASSDTHAPERRLASLIIIGLGVAVDPVLLRNFVAAYWDRIAPLAHAIHETAEPSPAEERPPCPSKP